MVIKLVRKDSNDSDFRGLVSLLDADLADRYGELQKKYDHLNKQAYCCAVVVAYADDMPVGCGILKPYNNHIAEVKRMFVKPGHRRKGISKKILHELELWARESEYNKLILETGKGQLEAIGLYQSNGFKITASYGVYVDMPNSICMAKVLMD